MWVSLNFFNGGLPLIAAYKVVVQLEVGLLVTIDELHRGSRANGGKARSVGFRNQVWNSEI
jgi:hypothetical protein